MRLAKRLGLDVDPIFGPGVAVRRAIEVYPRPAEVTLFGRQRALQYKAKSRRSLDVRRAAFENLFSGLEGTVDASPAMNFHASSRWEFLSRGPVRRGAELPSIESKMKLTPTSAPTLASITGNTVLHAVALWGISCLGISSRR